MVSAIQRVGQNRMHGVRPELVLGLDPALAQPCELFFISCAMNRVLESMYFST